MSNPVLNERVLQQAPRAGASAPPPVGDHFPAPVLEPPTAPITDGPVSPWSRAMTVNGAISATATLLVLLLAAATVGWLITPGPEEVVLADGRIALSYSIPMLAWGGLVVGFGLVVLLYFKPHLAKFLGPIYAIAEGIFVGAVSKGYESLYDGIVVQAAGATAAVFAVMLVLYRTRIIKVTERFRTIVVTATMGVMVFYGVALLLRLFVGAESVSFLSSPSLLGIGFSVLVAGLAAFNLALDFDFIERGAARAIHRDYEWFVAVGMLVTIVWLYLELLRLLSKLQRR